MCVVLGALQSLRSVVWCGGSLGHEVRGLFYLGAWPSNVRASATQPQPRKQACDTCDLRASDITAAWRHTLRTTHLWPLLFQLLLL